MTSAAEGQPVVTAPRERGWRGLVLATVGVAAVSAVSAWPPSLALLGVAVRWALPIEGMGSLVLLGLAACAVAAWARGGRVVPAALAVGAVAVWLRRSAPADDLGHLTTGWSLLAAACFGWWALTGGERPFLSRALPALGAAGALALAALVWWTTGTRDGLGRFGAAYTQALQAHRTESLARWEARRADPSWVAVTSRVPAVQRLAERAAGGLAALSPPTAVFPALLVLETLAAFALAWATWHRIARARLGPPLAPLSQFRFNDQLVWGLVVGATLVLQPSLSGWRGAGVNLVVVFGALHVVRGIGVLLWWLPDRWAFVPLLLLLVSLPLLGPVLVLATVAVLALGLGLGDTWRDFRRTTRSWRPDARP